MGLFSSPADKYSAHEQYLSEHDLKRVVNHERIHILEQDKVERIREAILKRRMGDGKISLRQIYKLLQTMVPDEINKFERDAVMEAVADLFDKKL